MRPLNLKMMFPLLVLVAAPFLGWGGQAQAGMLCMEPTPHSAEPSFFGTPSLGGDWWQKQPEASSAPSISQAPEAVVDRADKMDHGLESTPLSLLVDLPGQITTELVEVHHEQSPCPESRTTVPPAELASLCLSGPRTQLPDPLLSRLFRPPR